MADSDEIAKQVDSIYKGLLDRFHPAARQLVSTGKAYLKALHGASASGRAYYEAVQKVALQTGARGDHAAPHDIGESLHQLSSVYQQLQAQELTALRAFYVDLLVPLETNIEKDVKQLQSEQKSFLSGHKQRKEAHSKAAATVKRNRKKGRSRANQLDKQIKHYQALEESKARLDAYLTQGLQAALQQERRRLGFVLERHCSLSRHHLALHSQGAALLHASLHDWAAVAATRDQPPDTPAAGDPPTYYHDEMREEEGDAIYSTPSLELCELDTRVRRARSVDLSCLEAEDSTYLPGQDRGRGPPPPLPRAVSDLHLDSPRSEDRDTSCSSEGRRTLAKALYNYTASADTQLSFMEGDTIQLIGDRADGWQYGENTRSQSRGWFPVAYTEDAAAGDDGTDSALGAVPQHQKSAGSGTVTSWRSAASDTASSDTMTSVGTVRAAHTAPPAAAASRLPKTSPDASDGGGQSSHHSKQQPDVTPNLLHALQQAKKRFSSSRDRYSSNNINNSTSDHNTNSNDKYTCFSSTTTTDKYISSSSGGGGGGGGGVDYNTNTPDRYIERYGRKTCVGGEVDTRSDTSISLSCSLPGLASSSSSSSTQRGRVSFHSSNDSGFSNDGSRPAQPTVDYSDADSYRNRCLDSSFASCDTEPLTYFPTRVQGRSYSLGRCDDHHFYKREKSHCRDPHCDCNAPTESKQAAVLSPSAKKIMALRVSKASHKKGKSSLRRSKSLLCLGMNSCRGVPDDLMSNDYEEMFANDWYHRSLVDVSQDIPAPPKHEPPTPPCAECLSSSCNSSCTYCSHDLDLENSFSELNNSDRSMPNRVAMKPCKPKKRPPMPLPIEALTSEPRVTDHSPPVPPAYVTLNRGKKTHDSKKSTSIETKRESSIMSKSLNRLSRSLTWTSPKTNQQNNKQTYLYESHTTAHNNHINSMKTSRHHSREKSNSSHIPTIEECPKTPPLPPRSKKFPRPLESPAPEPVNMLTYADFIARRLRYPEGISSLDQQSSNGRHMCGKWYDLWDESTSCTEI